MKVSVVVSVFNEEQVLTSFYEQAVAVLSNPEYQYELIFVNDGSTDGSQAIIDNLTENNPAVKSITFSRNFGHEAAMIAGIDFTTGDAIICMDSDLQHPPALIPAIVEEFRLKNVDVVNLVRDNRKKQYLSGFFYKLINKISPYKIEENASDFFLISARVADVMRTNFRERIRFLRGFVQMVGFRKSSILYSADERLAGQSKYSTRKLLSLSVVAIATMSKAPLKAGIYAGLISGAFSFILAVYSVIMKFVDKPVSGYTTIVVFLGIMFSIQFILLGIIGQYIGFLFDEQKGRPIYIIEKTSNCKPEVN